MKAVKNKLFKNILLVFILAINSIVGIVFCCRNVGAYADTETEEKSYCTATFDKEFSDNEIIVVLSHSISISGKHYSVNDFAEIDCSCVDDLTYGLFESGKSNEEKFNRILMLTIKNVGKENVLEAIKILEKRKDILSAEPNYIESFCASTENEENYVIEEQKAIIDKPLLTLSKKPNDTYYVDGSQWAIDKISLPQAWHYTTGSSTVTVGIIDSGIDSTHPDLKNRVNVNLSKSFGDTVSNPLEDNSGHGTHIAGIIGAQGNNDLGITGACWNVNLVSLQIDYSDGKNIYKNISAAIAYAGINNIPILNMSGGHLSPINYFKEAIENYNGLFVCTAGNDNNDNDKNSYYPGNMRLPNLISVANSDTYDFVGKDSNYGKTTVDIFAPGEGIKSTLPVWKKPYGYKSGTSMAAPYVAGVAALLLSENPNIPASALKNAIMNNVDKVDKFSDKCVSGGRLNAYKAVKSVHRHTYSGSYSYVNQQYHRTNCTTCYETTNSGHWAYASSTGRYKKCEACGGSIDTDRYPIILINGGTLSASLTLNQNTIISSTNQLENYLNLYESETVLTSEQTGAIIEYYDEKFFAEYSIMFGDIGFNEVSYWMLKNSLGWQAE